LNGLDVLFYFIFLNTCSR